MPTPTVITDLSQTAASNYPAGTDSPSVLDDVQRAHAAFIALLRDGKGQTAVKTVASAGTSDIGGENSFCVEITGTTTITSFGTNYNGPRFVRFTGALILTHNATLLNLPGAANITTAAGDTAIATPNSTGNGWNITSYQRAATAPDFATTDAVNAAIAAAVAGIVTTPPGQIAPFALASAPTGWLKANGGTIGSATSGGTLRANADVSALFTALWTDFSNTILPIQDSAGAASTRGASAAADFAANKRMPVFDLRGEFIRGLDDGRGIDAARVEGSLQLDQMQGHYHSNTVYGGSGGATSTTGGNGTAANTVSNVTAPITDGTNGTPRTGTETRPRNVALLVCIKY